MPSWFSRHLNWTYIIALLFFLFPLPLAVRFVLWSLQAFLGKELVYADVMFQVFAGIGMLIISLWIIERKGQSWAWIFLSSLFVPLWLPTKKFRSAFQLSSIHKRTETEKLIHTDFELSYLQEVMSCPNCAFADQQSMNQGNPCCDAPGLPVIENKYCRTWERATSR